MLRVFITGASSGIGAALAREFAVRGAQLGLLARRESALHALVASLPNASRHLIYPVDVNDHAALQAAAQNFLRRADGVDIVIANAGISYGTLTERPEDFAVFETILQTNLMATVATFAPFIDAMKTQAAAGERGMRLVGIGSVAGIRGLPGAEAYSASKAAVMSYCESLRVELNPHRIRVVTIAPGYIDTPMTKVNRYPMPFLMPAPRFARLAADVIRRGRSYAVIPWQMRGVSWLLRLLPNWLYDRVMANAPHKTSLKDHPHSDVTAG
jgi:NAD(P)-dependent dehydrogenase (short-subunit alcohol dehydrogenase family)